MKKYVFNPINNKTPKGAVIVGTEVKYTLKVSKFESVTNAYFVMHKDGFGEIKYDMCKDLVDDKYSYYSYSCKFEEIGHFWYHFEIKYNDYSVKLIRSDNLDVVESQADNDYLQLVIKEESKADKEYRKGIIYHIFVDRFNKVGEVKCREGLRLLDDWNTPVDFHYNEKGHKVNINCYGGNLKGIIEKLPYLKSLNVGTIYLSPIFEAHSSHKYDVADYSKVDSMFGDFEVLEELIKKSKRQGMKIIIDGVFNHTGSDSIYFNRENRYKNIGAYQSQDSPYYDWYCFTNYPNEYSSWWGFDTLPQINENSGFFDFITGKDGIVEKYMSLGIGGMRLDVVDELSNKFISAICSASKRINPKSFMVGEVWEDASCKIAYGERKEYFLGGNLDSVTNYPMKNSILEFVKYGRVDNFVNTVNLILDQYPKSIRDNLMNIIDTHDTIRAITYLGADTTSPDYCENEKYILSEEEMDRGIKLLKLASIMQYTIMGIPTLFYGDEVGIQGIKDPFCRQTYPWGKENLTLLEWYKKLGELRNNQVLIDGDMRIRYADNGVIIYERFKDNNKVIVAVNCGSESFDFILERDMKDYFTSNLVNGKVTLGINEALVLI